jgi:chorismate lyase
MANSWANSWANDWAHDSADDWISTERRRHLTLPARVRDWVGLETSMTARIAEVSGHPITVELLRQAKAPLNPDEVDFFDPAPAGATVREVCLSAAGQPLLVARTVLTSQRLQTHPTIVKLGTKALGSLLFAGGKPSPYTAREFARIGAHNPLYRLVRSRAGVIQSHYWGRRTLFWLFDEPLLVTEVMLPALIHHPRAAAVTRNIVP